MLTAARDAFSQFSERSKLFLVAFAFSLLAILLSLWLGGLLATTIITVPALVAVLQVTKGVWTPEGGGKSKIGMASLGVALAAVALSPRWHPFVNSLLGPLLDEHPALKGSLPADAPSIAALLFLVAVIFVVNYFARDTTAMKAHPSPVEKEFPEKGYREALKLFKQMLETDLTSLDNELNWSAATFVPLDAEVEVKSGPRRRRRITDLLSAVRADRRSKVFLVLGDPGSGKSVALRKLCRELLGEIAPTGRVPLYVNLKEWEPKEPWTEEAPPTPAQVYDFVLANLKSRTRVTGNTFLDTYFERMFEDGRLFLVLDSFDEIPSVLDVSENSWLIDRLSEALYKFLAGPHESRGILASRIFRRPTKKFDAPATLEIRPFTEGKIVQTLKNYMTYNEGLADLLFNRRPEFAALARNPFTAVLISDYARENANTLPETQADLYSSYVARRLGACRERMQEMGLSEREVLACATDIAHVMFTTEKFGLEAPVAELAARLPRRRVEQVIDLLIFAQLARLGRGHRRRFSFVHRRFNEYFAVRRLRQRRALVQTDSIPTDSRWRDALVLYCEVAEEERATDIARFCWSEVARMDDEKLDMRAPQYLRSVHCLRFLKEAFRARTRCVESFRDELAAFIRSRIEAGDNLLTQKFAVEAVGLLDPEDIDEALTQALGVGNPWIDETALKSCHYLPRTSRELNDALALFIDKTDTASFVRRARELMFSLKLSNVFADLRSFCLWRLVYVGCAAAAVLVLLARSPMLTWLTLTLLAALSFARLVAGKLSATSERTRTLWSIFKGRVAFAACLLLPALAAEAARSQSLTAQLPPEAREFLNLHVRPHYLYSLFTFSLFDLGDAEASTLLLVVACLLVPWYEVRHYVRQLFRARRQRKRAEAGAATEAAPGATRSFAEAVAGKLIDLVGEIVGAALGFLALGVAFGVAGSILSGVIWLVKTYVLSRIELPEMSVPEPLQVAFGAFVLLAIAAALLVGLFNFFKFFWDEHRRLRRFRPDVEMTRGQIAEFFHGFKTEHWRLKFVRSLQSVKVQPNSLWPDGKLPRVGNDEASTLLAKLEERWLGLDR